MEPIDLNSPEVKAAIKAAVDDATEGLARKRDELLGEVKQLKKGRSIDPADVEKLEGELDTLRSQLTDAQKAAKKAQDGEAKAIKARDDSEGAVSKLLVDNGLTDALAKNGVNNPALVKAAKAMFATQAQVADDNGSKVARIGDKSLADAIAEWAGTDEGKHFVTAHDASGGGSQGGHKGGGAAKTIKTSEFNALRPADRATHMAAGYTLLPD